MIDLAGRVALVTGGSVGTKMAHAFLDAGASVAMVFRNPSRELGLAAEFKSSGSAFKAIRADLSDYRDARNAAGSVKRTFGGIDFLLNSLGGWLGGKKLHEHEPSDLDQMFAMDVKPTFNIMSAVLPHMMEQKFGRVVNFLSMQVFGNGEGNAVYSASKSAVWALTRTAAAEYKEYGIAVYGVAPSIIDTDNNRKWMPQADTSKWVKPEEIIDAILFLCRTGKSMNGTVLKF